MFAIARHARVDFDPARLGTGLFAGALVILLAGFVGLHMSMESRARRGTSISARHH